VHCLTGWASEVGVGGGGKFVDRGRNTSSNSTRRHALANQTV